MLCCHKYILRDTIAATEFLSLERKDKIQINGRSFLAIDFRPALPLFCWSWPFLTFAVAQLGISPVAHSCAENCLVTGKMDFGSAWGVACSIYSPLIQVPFVIPHFLCQQERVATNTVLSTFLELDRLQLSFIKCSVVSRTWNWSSLTLVAAYFRCIIAPCSTKEPGTMTTGGTVHVGSVGCCLEHVGSVECCLEHDQKPGWEGLTRDLDLFACHSRVWNESELKFTCQLK